MFNKVHVGDCREVMAGLPEGSVDLVVTSPPYWGLRKYPSTETIWGGDASCEHIWGEELPPMVERHSDEGYRERSQKNGYSGAVKMTEAAQDRPRSSGSYCQLCGAWIGQLGHEPHPSIYIKHLIEVSREIRRVLRPSGTYWLNLGDTYCTLAGKSNSPGGDIKRGLGKIQPPSSPNRILKKDGGWIQEKQLLLIPARVAIALQDDRWILRNDIIWWKRNAMPTSAKDRFKVSHEHIFFLVKQPRYYFNLDAIRKPYSEGTLLRVLQKNVPNQKGGEKQSQLRGDGGGNRGKSDKMVKAIAAKWKETQRMEQMQREVGYGRTAAAFNQEHADKIVSNINLMKHEIAVGRIGKGYSYTDSLHGENTAYTLEGATLGDVWDVPTHGFAGAHFAVYPEELIEPIIKAACPPQGVVLDPFAGSGTTLRVARRLGRQWVGIELNPEYAEMCMARVKADDYAKTPDDVMSLIHFNEGA